MLISIIGSRNTECKWLNINSNKLMAVMAQFKLFFCFYLCSGRITEINKFNEEFNGSNLLTFTIEFLHDYQGVRIKD